MIPATGWTYEVHELSEGFSAIVYDEHGWMVADHLDEDRAALVAASPDMLEALYLVGAFLYATAPESNELQIVRRAIAKALGRTPNAKDGQ